MSDFDNKYNKAYENSRKSGLNYADRLLGALGLKPVKDEEDDDEEEKKKKFQRVRDMMDNKDGND